MKDVIESQEEETAALQNLFEQKCADHLELTKKQEQLQNDYDSVLEKIDGMKVCAEENSDLVISYQNLQTEKDELDAKMSSAERKLTEQEIMLNEMVKLQELMKDTENTIDKKQNIISELRNRLNFGKEILLEKQVESLKFEEDAKNYESTLSEKQSEIERLQVEGRQFEDMFESERGIQITIYA